MLEEVGICDPDASLAGVPDASAYLDPLNFAANVEHRSKEPASFCLDPDDTRDDEPGSLFDS